MTQNMLGDVGYLSMTTDNKTTENEANKAAEAPPPSKKELTIKGFIKQGISIILALGLLYWCFKDQDLPTLWRYVQECDFKFVLAVCVCGVVSHILRAWRWVILLQPLSEKPIGLFNSFCAVMYGYAVNLVVPRGGEVARLVSISKTESIPWAGVLPTMFIDRLLDIAMLVMLIGLTITQLPASLNLKWVGPAGASMCAATVVGLVALPFVGKLGRLFISRSFVQKLLPAAISSKLDALLVQFELGTRSLTNAGNLLAIAAFSFAIWACYWANLYLMIYAFHLEKTMDIAKSLLVFTVSSVSVLVPTPGNVGSYHLLTSQALVKIAGTSDSLALAYAAMSHLLSFVVVTCVPAAVCFVIQSSRAKR